MSEIEEPPSKVSKLEEASSLNDSAEEGQEEWLSEGILTDDDYNTNENDQSDIGQVSNDDTMQSLESENQPNDMSIEETLNTLDSTAKTETSFTDELEKYLIKKPEPIEDVKKDDDDNNSTDYLLKMLEEKTEDTQPIDKTVVEESSTDDDLDNILAKGNVTNIKTIKNNIKTAPLAAPEDTTDTDSSDVAGTMNKMFLQKTKQAVKEASKQATKPASKRQNAIKSTAKPSTPQPKKIQLKNEQSKLVTSTPTRRETRSSVMKSASKDNSRLSKPEIKMSQEKPKASKQSERQPEKQPSRPSRILQIKQAEPNKIIQSSKPTPSKAVSKPSSAKKPAPVVQTPPKAKPKHQGTIKQNEATKKNTDAEFDRLLNEPVEEIYKNQDIMRPEEMDDELLSDDYSLSDGSFYDEIFSSDSGSDLEDWFRIDLRAEKASDYIPLLGNQALETLLEEKQRLSSRISTLQRNLGSLTESARQQTDRLRAATATLAEVDAMLMAN